MAWEGFIRPSAILALVRNTAPFLYEGLTLEPYSSLRARATGANGFLRILAAADGLEDADLTEEERHIEYFTLCLASHHATVATFVPTDVDTKIRGLLWNGTRDRDVLRAMGELAVAMHGWSLAGISKRVVTLDEDGPVSGHDGEWLSVAAGAHGRFLQMGETEWAERMASAIDAELRREARVFAKALDKPGLEIETLQLAMSITHNLGDLDQGISFWENRTVTAESRVRFGRIAHENADAYGGGLRIPAKLYRENLAAEGHRHYPLRAVKPLRRSADLLLPLGPFFDEWGETIGKHPVLSAEDRAEALDALVKGCRKVANQAGYYRAIAGMQSAGREFERAVELLPNSTRRELRDPEMRRLTAVPRRSFESALVKKVVAVRPRRG
ncbi:MAG: hypothetical protein U0Q16_21170 [Bryobacteraceae bacterium]